MTPPTILEALIARDLLALLDDVCHRRGVTREELCGRGRTKNLAFARQELWWHLRRHPGMSYEEIGRLFDRNKTTILTGVRTFERAREEAISQTAAGASPPAATASSTSGRASSRPRLPPWQEPQRHSMTTTTAYCRRQ